MAPQSSSRPHARTTRNPIASQNPRARTQPARTKSQQTKAPKHSAPKPLLALDGPSTLAYYRDRDDRVQLPDETEYAHDDFAWYAQSLHYSDPHALADTHVFGGESHTPSDPHALADTHVFGGQSYIPSDETVSAPSDSRTPRRTRATDLARCSSCSRDIKLVPFEDLGVRPPDAHSELYILVSGQASRRVVRNVHQRICGRDIPRDAFKLLGSSVLLPTPEFCFLLLAQYVGLVELIQLGMEMCGHYRVVGGRTRAPTSSNRTIYNCDRLTTPEKLRTFVEQMRDFPGARLALRACEHIVPDSCSPMETVIYLLLCLPCSLGGYALPRPVLNAKRVVNRQAGSFTLSRRLIPDLYWSAARLDIEYDSDEFHADPESLKKGARRTLALRAMHVDVISLTSDMVYDETAFAGVARLAAKKVGKRLRPQAPTVDKLRNLRQTLLASTQEP